MIDIGRVFATSWAMLRQRFWLLVGMFAVFFAIQVVGAVVMVLVLGLLGAVGEAGIGAGLENPTALTGMGIGIIMLAIVFYGVYLVLVLAQQAALVVIASPLEEASFGTAMARGFKSALPFLGIALILLVGYFAISAAIFAVAGVAGIAGGLAGNAAGTVMSLLLMPILIYLGCRMAVLVPVVAVDQVWGPISAIRRSWAVTRGRVLGIFLATLAFGVLTLAIVGLPFLLMFGAVFSAEQSPGASAGVALLGMLLFIPLFVAYTAFAAAYSGALHSELTGGGAERLEEVFA